VSPLLAPATHHTFSALAKRFRENNYLHKSQIVKEQPISDASMKKKHHSAAPWRARLNADSSNDVLVEPIGIEPMTSCLQSRRSPS
jgi:hypothetical protein